MRRINLKLRMHTYTQRKGSRENTKKFGMPYSKEVVTAVLHCGNFVPFMYSGDQAASPDEQNTKQIYSSVHLQQNNIK